MALQVEDAVRKTGAIPATIGLVEGQVIVGMDRSHIEAFGKAGKVMSNSIDQG